MQEFVEKKMFHEDVGSDVVDGKIATRSGPIVSMAPP